MRSTVMKKKLNVSYLKKLPKLSQSSKKATSMSPWFQLEPLVKLFHQAVVEVAINKKQKL